MAEPFINKPYYKETARDFLKLYIRGIKLLISILPVVLLPVLIFRSSREIQNSNTESLNTENFIFSNMGILFIVFSLILFNTIYSYLQKGKITNPLPDSNIYADLKSELNYKTREIEKQLGNIQSVLAQATNVLKNNSFENNSIIDKDIQLKLVDKIESNISGIVLNSLQEKYSQAFISENRYIDIVNDFNFTKDRIQREINKLSNRANINLTIGSTTTIVAIALLWLTVNLFSHNSESGRIIWSSNSLFYVFIPRVSIVIFIEIFAFFFLKLYKNNLEGIKYYHNELTNIELKLSALKSSLNENNSGSAILNEVISDLSKTERNIVLKSDETTVELEKMRLNSKEKDSIITALRDTIAGLKPK